MGKILIVDDDPNIRALVSKYFIKAGYRVCLAENGQDALEQATTNTPDLIILDINMPVMDGTRVMKTLRSTPETADIPVVALSALAASGMRDDMHQLGCAAYVVKPINFDTLMNTVRNLIPL